MKGTKDTNYVFPKKEDVEIVVGDEKQDRFYPRMKIMRWDNEVNFSVGVISEHIGSDSKKDNKVGWNDGHGTKARFYEKEGDEFEFEIELASKPASNVLHLSIETKGLDFFYQPELTEEEILEGCDRPDNIVGSYAVYHKTIQGNYIGGNNYRAGKALHIYRPYAIDSKGTKVWCDLHIGKDLLITIPQDFLDKAVYPIIVDPTFGCDPDSPGGTDRQIQNYNANAGGKYPLSVVGVITSISWYGRGRNTTEYIMLGVFDDDDSANGSPNGEAKKAETDSYIVNSTSNQWWTRDLTTNPSLPVDDYWFGFISNGYPYLKYDTVTNQGWWGSTKHPAYNVFNNPWGTGGATINHKYSIYCTYPSTGIARSKIDGGLAGRGHINGGLTR